MTSYPSRSSRGLIAVLVALSANPVRASQDTAAGLRDQLSYTLPEGWVVWDEAEASGQPGPIGLVIFSAEPVMKGPTAPADEALISRFHSGEVPAIVLERVRAGKGMSCEKLTRPAILFIGSWVKQDPTVDTIGQRLSGKIAPDHTDIELGGCRGVRFVVEAHGNDPAKHRVVDVRAVSDGTVLYLFSLRNKGTHYARNLEAFEAVVGSVRLAAAREKH